MSVAHGIVGLSASLVVSLAAVAQESAVRAFEFKGFQGMIDAHTVEDVLAYRPPEVPADAPATWGWSGIAYDGLVWFRDDSWALIRYSPLAGHADRTFTCFGAETRSLFPHMSTFVGETPDFFWYGTGQTEVCTTDIHPQEQRFLKTGRRIVHLAKDVRAAFNAIAVRGRPGEFTHEESVAEQHFTFRPDESPDNSSIHLWASENADGVTTYVHAVLRPDRTTFLMRVSMKEVDASGFSLPQRPTTLSAVRAQAGVETRVAIRDHIGLDQWPKTDHIIPHEADMREQSSFQPGSFIE